MKHMTINPCCPDCSARSKRNGKRNGKQIYKCSECARSFVENPIAPSGRPLINDKPLTPAEKMQRYRANKRDSV